MRRACRLPVWLTPLLLTAACAPTTVQLRLRSQTQTNAGRPLAVLVRRVDAGAAAFRSQRYSEMEQLVTAPDASVLRSLFVYPQVRGVRCIEFPYPSTGSFAIYALYAEPSGQWKVLYEPTLPDKIELWLGPAGLDLARSRERRPLLAPRDPDLAKSRAVRSALTDAATGAAKDAVKAAAPPVPDSAATGAESLRKAVSPPAPAGGPQK